MRRKRSSGFTLIELLVVIAIIAILAAILFPIYSSAKERGRQVRCLSNLKQLSTAFTLYMDDWGGRYPTARISQGAYLTGWKDWCGSTNVGTAVYPEKGQIYKYCKNKQIFLCPTDQGRKADAVGNSPYDPYLKMHFALSYSMNFKMQFLNMGDIRKQHLSKLLLLIHESRHTINDGDFRWEATDVPDDVHWDGTTALYCDGHASWASAKALLKARDHNEWDPTKPDIPY